MYYALCHSIWTYGITAWGGAYNKEINPLQNILNRILKRIPELKAEILDVKNTFKLHSLLHHYDKCSQDYNKSTSKTRNKSLTIPDINKDIFKKSSHYIALTSFNMLNHDLKNINNTTSNNSNLRRARKSRLKKHIISLK